MQGMPFLAEFLYRSAYSFFPESVPQINIVLERWREIDWSFTEAGEFALLHQRQEIQRLVCGSIM